MIMIAMATKLFMIFLVLLCVAASPAPRRVSLLEPREELQKCTTEPYFPDDPKSCGICQQVRSPLLYTVLSSHAVSQSYGDIDGCVDAAPVLANFSMVRLNEANFTHSLIARRIPPDHLQSWRLRRRHPLCVHGHVQVRLSSVRRLVRSASLSPALPRLTTRRLVASSRRTRVTC